MHALADVEDQIPPIASSQSRDQLLQMADAIRLMPKSPQRILNRINRIRAIEFCRCFKARESDAGSDNASGKWSSGFENQS